MIEPRTLRGFTDVFPQTVRHQRRLIRAAEETFDSFGYDPIQTPALEYAEILRGKGGTESDKQMFEFDDQGGRRVALRFDLTVPLARFVAQHSGRLRTPARIYNIGPVWRGERPQRGRYREFLQCDADVIGDVGIAADAEVVTMLHAALRRMDIGRVIIRVNNRKILNGVLAAAGVGDRLVPTLRAIDKLDKIGEIGVGEELTALGIGTDVVDRILAFTSMKRGDDGETLDEASRLIAGDEAERGLAEVRQLLDLVAAGGGRDAEVTFDPGIARGLDYYTGTVFETTLCSAPDVGSVCSGGRYDDLAGLYTKARLPGVGGSIGISRVLSAVPDDLPAVRARPLAMITMAAAAELPELLALAAALRENGGCDVEVYPTPAKHATQMKHADQRGARLVLTRDPDGPVSVKDMVGGQRRSYARESVVGEVARTLAGT